MENIEIRGDISNNINVKKNTKKYSNILEEIKKNKQDTKKEKKIECCISQKIEKI